MILRSGLTQPLLARAWNPGLPALAMTV